MFSVRQKREIAGAVQQLLRSTNHPELPEGEIRFTLHVAGSSQMSWAVIQNNGAVSDPAVNPHNEMMDNGTKINPNAGTKPAYPHGRFASKERGGV